MFMPVVPVYWLGAKDIAVDSKIYVFDLLIIVLIMLKGFCAFYSWIDILIIILMVMQILLIMKKI